MDRKRDVFEPSVQAKKGDKSILMLTYYRNNLIHNFANEALLANSILGVSNIQSISQGIPVSQLWEKVQYLRDLLSEEFTLRNELTSTADLTAMVKFLDSRGFLVYDERTQQVSMDTKNERQGYGQSFLYHLLLPTIESYWISLSFFLT